MAVDYRRHMRGMNGASRGRWAFTGGGCMILGYSYLVRRVLVVFICADKYSALAILR